MQRTRVIRYILLIILAIFVFYIIRKYRFKEPEPPEPEPEMAIEENSQVGLGTEIVQSKFKLKARRSIYKESGDITYQDFEFQTFKGEKQITITGDTADVVVKIDQIRRAILRGNIKGFTSDGLEFNSERLNYFYRQNCLASPQTVHFKKGQLSGRANRFLYFLDPTIIQLIGDVELEIKQEELPEGAIDSSNANNERIAADDSKKEDEADAVQPKPSIFISCGFVQYEPQKHTFFLDGNVSIKRGQEFLNSQRIDGTLTEDNRLIMQMEAQGAIESRFGSTGSEDKQTNAPPLGGQNLNVLKLSEGIKNLSCRNLIIYFTPDEENAPQKIEAKGDAQLEILLRSKKTDKVIERRKITAEQLEMELNPSQQQIKKFAAKERAKIEIYNTRNLQPEKTMEANEINGRFDPATGALINAEFIGNFKFFQGSLEAIARRGIYSDKEGSLEMTGNPQVLQEGNKVTADKMYYSHKDEELLAQDNVVSEQPPKTLKEMFNISGAEEPAVFNSNMMIYNHNKHTIHYFGNVKGLFGGNILWADRALILQNEGKLTAEGNVKSILPQEPKEDSENKGEKLEVISPYMFYDNEKGIIEYRKGVDMRQGTIKITAEEIDLYQTKGENSLDHAFARTDVEVIRGDMNAQGDTATYNFKNKEMEVRGEEARFMQKGKMTHNGKILTFFLDNDKMILKADEDGRVKTVYRPQ
jgi:lipopolysaccharide transport protein LptA